METGTGKLFVFTKAKVFVSTVVVGIGACACAEGGIATAGTTEGDQLEDDCSWERREATDNVSPPSSAWPEDGPGIFAVTGAG